MGQSQLIARRVLIIVGVCVLVLTVMWGRNGETAVRGKLPAQPLNQPLSTTEQIAQTVALADPNVQAKTADQRSELFGIREMATQFTPQSARCADTHCKQVEIYNYESNSTILAIVDTEAQIVLDVLELPHSQPGINARLAEKALDIAMTHPDVIAELGFEPTSADMAPVSAGIRGSVCDQHLCVGPTFRVGDRVLWAIVDLTEETLAGLNWTDVPENGRFHSITGGSTCPADGTVNQMGWQLSYETTSSDGLRVYNASFMGRPVLESAKLLEWHVDYNGTFTFAGFLDSTGCGGSGGFFVHAVGETQILDLVENSAVVGFEVVQDFRMSNWGDACNYRYEQRMQFYENGRFRIVSGAFGRGCGFFPVYRPVVRIDLAIDSANQEQVGYWTGQHWTQPTGELYLTPHTAQFGPSGHVLAENDALLWLMNQNGAGYYLLPGKGDSGAERGDAPFVYITKHNTAEGVTDMPVFGGLCCENDHQQGPHYYVNNEPIQDENLVIWYVAQHATHVNESDHSDDYCWTVSGVAPVETYPCYGGPMFVPFGYDDGSITADFAINATDMTYPDVATFTNQSIVNDNVPVNYLWTFGDGQTAMGENPSHLYLLPGPFAPSLTVDGFLNGQATKVLETAVVVDVENALSPFVSK